MGKTVRRSETRIGSFALATLLLAIVPVAGGTSVQTSIKVSITRVSCRVSPRTVVAGKVIFGITNQSGRWARFSIASRRVTVPTDRATRLTTSLNVGRAAYTCSVAGRRVGQGALRVTSPPQPAPEHRIGVRDVDGFGEFYDRTSGSQFVPRGSNYIRLAPQVVGGQTQVYHSTFIVGRYDAARAEGALARMAASGYNVVRVFLSNTCASGCSAKTNTGQISSSYVANLVDFLRRARAHRIYVLLTSEWLPGGAAFDSISASVRREWFDDVNIIFLSPQGLQMSVLFWQSLVRELIRQHAPLDAVFAYSLANEAVVTSARPPYTLASGRVITASGGSYDMASNVDRKRMIDDAFVFYIDQVRSAILRIDPTALVTMGFFHDKEPNPAREGDARLVRTRAVIEHSSADFVDIHPYPGDELGFAQLMQNYGIDGPVKKPIVIGEMGASRRVFGTSRAAAEALVDWQRRSCAYGIDGWLVWTWDAEEQPDLWNALSGGGVIEQALAPKNRPDYCG